ncbi:MAG: PEP-CTERM sorting domain-containing protein [Spartobacteria bacterium]|nr:PEP-CTERM sorting domain-containing protein [Spartobacteria bacterium]
MNSNITFSMSFSTVPDFMTVDSENRQAGSFQFWIDPSEGGEPIWSASTIIRGGEIYIGGDVPVRDRLGSGGAGSDGWGPVRDSVSYSQVGANVSFVVPYTAMGEDDGNFTYNFMVSEYGQAQFEGFGESGLSYQPVHTLPVLPEPSTFILLAAALGLVYLLRIREHKAHS